MVTEDSIKNDLQRLASSFAPAITCLATVKSVQVENATCTLTDDNGQDFFNVRLRPITGANKGFLSIPSVGSKVLIIKVEDSDSWMVIACEKVDKIQVIIGRENIKELINDFISAILHMKFTTNYGPTIDLVNKQEFINLQNRCNYVFE